MQSLKDVNTGVLAGNKPVSDKIRLIKTAKETIQAQEQVRERLKRPGSIRQIASELNVDKLMVLALKNGFNTVGEYRDYRAQQKGFNSFAEYRRSREERRAMEKNFPTVAAWRTHHRHERAKSMGITITEYNKIMLERVIRRSGKTQYEYYKDLRVNKARANGFDNPYQYRTHKKEQDIADPVQNQRAQVPLVRVSLPDGKLKVLTVPVGDLLDELFRSGRSNLDLLRRNIAKKLDIWISNKEMKATINFYNLDNPPWFELSYFSTNSKDRPERVVVGISKHYLGSCDVKLRK